MVAERANISVSMDPPRVPASTMARSVPGNARAASTRRMISKSVNPSRKTGQNPEKGSDKQRNDGTGYGYGKGDPSPVGQAAENRTAQVIGSQKMVPARLGERQGKILVQRTCPDEKRDHQDSDQNKDDDQNPALSWKGHISPSWLSILGSSHAQIRSAVRLAPT